MYLLKKSCTYILLRIKNDVNRKSLICAVNEWFLSMYCSNLDRLWVKKPCNYWRVWLTLCSHSRNWSRNIIVNFFFARWPLTYQYNVKKGFCTHGVLRPNINSFFSGRREDIFYAYLIKSAILNTESGFFKPSQIWNKISCNIYFVVL